MKWIFANAGVFEQYNKLYSITSTMVGNGNITKNTQVLVDRCRGFVQNDMSMTEDEYYEFCRNIGRILADFVGYPDLQDKIKRLGKTTLTKIREMPTDFKLEY